jgi:hypothetical protein
LPQSAQSLSDQTAVRGKAYQFVIDRAGDGSAYNWRRFAVFDYPVGPAPDATTSKPSSWYTAAQAYAAYEVVMGLTPLGAGTTLMAHSSNIDMALSSSTANDYFPVAMSGLAYAVDHGYAGASEGWTRISTASNFVSAMAGEHNTPHHGIVPRGWGGT